MKVGISKAIVCQAVKDWSRDQAAERAARTKTYIIYQDPNNIGCFVRCLDRIDPSLFGIAELFAYCSFERFLLLRYILCSNSGQY